jgi:hypothetical protein
MKERKEQLDKRDEVCATALVALVLRRGTYL